MKLFSPFLITFNLLLITSLIATTSQVNNGTVPKRRLKILVYSPTLGWSHMQFMGAVADSLVEAGHEVHFFRVLMNRRAEALPKEVFKVDPDNITNFMSPVIASGQLDMNKIGQMQDPFNGKNFHTFMFKQPIWKDFSTITAAICKELANETELLDSLAGQHFDVAISEMYDLCPFGLFHRIGAKTKLSTLALAMYQMVGRRFGIPTFSSYVTNFVSTTEGTPNMAFWERVVNFYNDVYEWAYLTDHSVRLEQPIMYKSFGPEFPSLKQITRNISLLFVNTNQFFELPRPISNKVINVGGLLEMKTKPLDNATTAILARSRAGVVLVSFGSFVDTRKMPKAMMAAFLRAFARFPDFEFIWKLDIEANDAELFANHKNVHPMHWMDQKSLLLHPKVRAFVSHCGLNSLSEAAQAGVPVLAIPIFADQLYNSVLARHKGMAVKLDVGELNQAGAEQKIWKGLEKVLHDPLYRSNAQLISRKLALSPFSARQKLIRWVEFAAEFPELNELNLPWEEELGLLAYYSVDVILFTLALIGAVLWVLFLSLKTLAKCWKEMMMKDNANDERNKLKKN